VTRRRNAEFLNRPGDAERWIRTPERTPARKPPDGGRFTARLTIDVTPAMRRRLKRAALERGGTVADMLRDLFAREFPPPPGDRHE
jgi:hypothetical protein